MILPSSGRKRGRKKRRKRRFCLRKDYLFPMRAFPPAAGWVFS